MELLKVRDSLLPLTESGVFRSANEADKRWGWNKPDFRSLDAEGEPVLERECWEGVKEETRWTDSGVKRVEEIWVWLELWDLTSVADAEVARLEDGGGGKWTEFRDLRMFECKDGKGGAVAFGGKVGLFVWEVMAKRSKTEQLEVGDVFIKN